MYEAAIKSGTTNALKSLVVAVPIVAFLSTNAVVKSQLNKNGVDSFSVLLLVFPFLGTRDESV